MTTTVNSAADTGLPDERPEPKAQSIMDLFAEWQALGQTDRISLSDEENEAVSDRMSGLVQSMKDIGPRTAGEMAAFVYARTLGFEVVCEEEDAKYLLDAIEAEPSEIMRLLRECVALRACINDPYSPQDDDWGNEAALRNLELRLTAIPARTAQEMAAKILVWTAYADLREVQLDYQLDPLILSEVWQLTGFSAS